MRQERLTFACVSTPRLENLKVLLPKVLPFVDEVILVVGRKDNEASQWLESLNSSKLKVVYRAWDDNFANQWNEYLKHVTEGWILLLDDDEVPSEDMLLSLDDYINKSNRGSNYCCIEFRSNSISEGQDLGPSNYYRQIFFRYQPKMRYEGGTVTGCHQYIVGYQSNKIIKSDRVYYHIKSLKDEYRNASRNYFIYGLWKQGARDGEQREEWHELKQILSRVYPEVKTFMELNDILVQGNIDQELKSWMIRRYNQYLNTNGYNEMRALPLYYFKYLHPEENSEEIN